MPINNCINCVNHMDCDIPDCDEYEVLEYDIIDCDEYEVLEMDTSHNLFIDKMIAAEGYALLQREENYRCQY